MSKLVTELIIFMDVPEIGRDHYLAALCYGSTLGDAIHVHVIHHDLGDYFALLSRLATLLELQQHTLQFLILFPELSDDLVLAGLVDDRIALDPLGLVGVAQSAQCLVVVVVGWRDRTDHDGLAVASQVGLQDSGQDTVSVRGH